MFNDSVSSWEGTADDETRLQIQGVRDQLKMIELELNGLAENGTATAEDINTLKGQITTEIENCKTALDALQHTFESVSYTHLEKGIQEENIFIFQKQGDNRTYFLL